MRILVSGLMGSGKSTQAKRLAAKYDLCFLSTGDVLRELSKKDNEQGRYLKDALVKGVMVDDKLVADLMRVRLEQEDAKNGFVSDSYPRHIGQIQYFDPKLEIIFYLNIDPEEAKRRLLARGRLEDTPELIDFRHKSQGGRIKELVDFYRNKIKVFDIDANRSEDEVFAQIMEHLDGAKT